MLLTQVTFFCILLLRVHRFLQLLSYKINYANKIKIAQLVMAILNSFTKKQNTSLSRIIPI